MAFEGFGVVGESSRQWFIEEEGRAILLHSVQTRPSSSVYPGMVVMSEVAELYLRQWGF